MLYQQRTFTCPAGPQNTSQRKWDLAMLSRDEFKKKYGIDDAEYERLTRGDE